jgi:hypothetical protein
MKTLKIEPTASTPSILFDLDSHVFQIDGNSYPENVVPFYEPVLSWLEAYVNNPHPQTIFEIRLKYISSNSLKQFLILLKLLTPLSEATKVEIKWYYDPADDDMLERGEFLSEMTGLEFIFIEEEPA